LDGPHFEELKATTLSGVYHGIPPVDNRFSRPQQPGISTLDRVYPQA